jgi:hypothetical protein
VAHDRNLAGTDHRKSGHNASASQAKAKSPAGKEREASEFFRTILRHLDRDCYQSDGANDDNPAVDVDYSGEERIAYRNRNEHPDRRRVLE